MAAEEFLINAASRRQVFIEGYKEDQASEMVPRLADAIYEAFTENFALMETETTTVTQFTAALAATNSSFREIIAEFIEMLLTGQNDFMEDESDFEAQTLALAIESQAVDISRQDIDRIMRRLNNTPISANGEFIRPYMVEFGRLAIQRIIRAIRALFFEGSNLNTIMREVFGRNSNGQYRGAVMMRFMRDATTEIFTVLQFMSSVARNETQRRSGVSTGYMWVSTLDSRTSTQCRSLDGNVYEFGRGPLPPIHRRCRSLTVAVLDQRFNQVDDETTRASRGSNGRQPVDASLTYYQWLRRQSRAFQDEVLGTTRARLLRNGGLTAERFAELNLNRRFQPRTLEEMRRLAPLAFEEAGL